MQNKLFFILLTVVTIGLINISAQETPKPPTQIKSISGGVLNGKAKSLTKPAFPAAAKAVNASGAVNVQVTIDENGDVVSASAVSGHPLLRQASEQAALTSKFAPTMLSGQPVRITGIIVYNFVMPMSVNQIGYELALAETSQSVQKYQLNSISSSFPTNWEAEIQAMQTLNSRLTPKAEKEKSVQPSAAMTSDTAAIPPREGIATRIGTYTGGTATSENYTLDDEAVAVIRDLQTKLESRLSVRENVLWSFRLGTILGKLKGQIDDAAKTQANLSELAQLSGRKPSDLPETISTKIGEIVELSQKDLSEAAAKEKLAALIQNLRDARSY
jgi:TonB family protein